MGVLPGYPSVNIEFATDTDSAVADDELEAEAGFDLPSIGILGRNVSMSLTFFSITTV